MLSALLLALFVQTPARAGRGPGTNACPAFAALTGHHAGAYFEGDVRSKWGAFPVLVSPNSPRLPPAMERGEAGVLFLHGFLPVEVAASTTGPACPAALTPGVAAKVVSTVDTRQLPPDARVWVTGCGNSQRVREGRLEMPVQSGACQLVVHATDSKWTWESAPIEVHPAQGSVLDVTLPQVQLVHWAGLVLDPSPAGYTIRGFPAGSRAAESGLAVGDELTHIAGAAIRGLSSEQVRALLVGPAESVVELQTTAGQRYIVPRARMDGSFSAGNVGLRIEAVGGRFVVAEVVGPAAKRGLRPGDVILGSDGTPAEEWTAGHLTLHWRGGGLRRVRIQRAGKEYTVIIPLRRLY